MDEESDVVRGRFIKDPETGEFLVIEKTAEYVEAILAFGRAECKHEDTKVYRVRITDGSVQVRKCCLECGHRVGAAIPQTDKAWLAGLPWQPEEHAASYRGRRVADRRAILLDLARRQHAERGRFTASYSEYIKSDAWRTKRALVLKRCGGVCEGCGRAKATEVHHTTYLHLFDEFLFELLGLCHGCHERITTERRRELEVPLEPQSTEGLPDN
jgi:hypothetical protein